MKVLVAADISSAAETLLDAVMHSEWPDRCEFHVVTVVERTTGRFSSQPELTESEIELCKHIADDRMRGIVSTLRRKVPRATVYGVVLVGGAVESIVAKAAEIGADLVIVGHQGTYHQGGFSLGGVAERIVQRAPCSVVIVKPKIVVKPVASARMQGANV